MRQDAIEERVRNYVAAERAEMPVPPTLSMRILRAVNEAGHPRRQRRLGFLRLAGAIAAILFIAGGIGIIRVAQSPAGVAEGTWSSAPAMSIPRAQHTATLLPNGKVLVVGGRGRYNIGAPWQPATGGVTSSAELYDPTTGEWSSTGPLGAPRFGHTATLLKNGKVLVAGGSSAVPAVDAPVPSLATAELYDPQTRSWSQAASMLTPRSDHTATLLLDGRVLVVGGTNSTTQEFGSVIAAAELFDPASNTWTAAPPLPSPRARHRAILLADGRVLVIGGIDTGYHCTGSPNAGTSCGYSTTGLNSTVLYDPSSNSWAPGPSMHFGRILPTSTLLADGRVLVVGDEGVNEQTAEIFDPSNNQWSLAPNPLVARASHVAVLLRDGDVLVAGGVGDKSAQVFDPRRHAWSAAGALSDIRSEATATVLKDGQVLVTGGFGTSSIPWASAELYDPSGIAQPTINMRSSVPLAWTELTLAMAALVVLVAIVLVARRRQARARRSGDVWIDP